MTDYVLDRRGLCLQSSCSMTLPCKRCHMMQYTNEINMRVLEIHSGDIFKTDREYKPVSLLKIPNNI